MTLSVKHTTQSAVADQGVPGEIGPSEWNEEHALTVGAASVLGATAGGPVAELTPSQAKALLAVAISDVTGLTAALAAKADLASPALTGVPTAPTAVADTNTTQIATTAYVQTELGQLTATNIAVTPTGTISATNVQAALAEVASEGVAGSEPFLTVGNSGNLTGERAITIGQGLVGTDAGANSTYTIRRGSENTVTNGLDWPQSNDAAVRIAAGIDGLSYGVVYKDGNGLNLYDPFSSTFRPGRVPGNFQVVDLTNCTINGSANQARVNGTHYWVYAYFASAGDVNASYEISTTAAGGGDPLGATNVTGWLFKNDGTRNKRLIGSVKSDAAGVFWRAGARGVFMSGIASYYHRQHLNYHMHVSGGNAATVSTEINSNQYLSALMWDDGAEPFIALSGSVQSTVAGAKVTIGVGIDGENPAYEEIPAYCATANQPVPFTVTVTGGDFSTTIHTYRIYMKNTTGTGTIVSGANFAMKLEQ